MTSRCLRTVITVCLVLCSVASVEGQIRRRSSTPRPFEREMLGGGGTNQLKNEANQALQRGDYQRTIDLSSTVLERNNTDHMAYYLRASARCELGFRVRDKKLLREGVADSREAIRYGQGQNMLYYIPYVYGMAKLAEVEGVKDHAETAVTVANQALQQPTLTVEQRAHLTFQRAGAKLTLGKFDDAVVDYDAALQIDPKLVMAYLGRADAYLAAGKPDKAGESHDQLVRAMPNSALAYDYRGVFRREHGNFDEALADFSRALQLDPKFHSALTNRGLTLLRIGRAVEAEADLSAALTLAPDQPIVYSLRGSARLAQGKTREAIADHRQALTFVPDEPKAHADLALSLYFAGQYPEALASFEKAQSLDPGMRHLDAWRYVILMQAGKAEDAKKLTAASIAKESKDREWVDKLLVYLGGGSSEDDLLKSVDKSDPLGADAELCEAHFYIGMSKKLAGDNQAAESHFQKALDTQATRLSAYRGAQFALKKFDAAGTKL